MPHHDGGFMEHWGFGWGHWGLGFLFWVAVIALVVVLIKSLSK